jgi:hypothetical protein
MSPNKKKNQRYLIQSSFKSNKKIWGTYNQILETGYKINNKGRKVKRNRVKNPIANIIFKEGKIFFIRPSQINNSIRLEVLGLPYHNIRKRTYRLITKGHKEKLYSIFKNHIDTMVRKGLYRKENISKITADDIEFKNAVCARKKRIYKCEFPIDILQKEKRTKSISPRRTGPKKEESLDDYSFKKKQPARKKSQQSLKQVLQKRVPSNKSLR